MSLLEIVITAALVLAVLLALRHIFKMRKRGCTCGCADCNKACERAYKK